MIRTSSLNTYIGLIFSSFILFTSNISHAKSNNIKLTIYESSIKWDDETSRSKLLQSAPKWQSDVIQLMFTAYLHPKHYQLPKLNDSHKYATQFINAFWGPLDNPFTKYQRPAKAFVFIEKQNAQGFNASVTPQAFYMAPLVQNAEDGKYYVFDKDQNAPISLDGWIENIKNSYNKRTSLRFNLCLGYGNLPTDICTETYYQQEVTFTKKYFFKGEKDKGPSAHRGLYEDWRTKVQAFNFLKPKDLASDYIYGESIDWRDVDARNSLLNTVISWPSVHSIKDSFKKIRDLRYFTDVDHPPFLRRISWLFPDDGCWTRASATIRDLFGPVNNVVNQLPRPSKVFVFGNLCANSKNSPSGYVSWWYHTAPIVKDAETNRTFVLDPSINPFVPLELEKWIVEISARTGPCSASNSEVRRFAICNGFGTHPYESCQDPNYVNFATETSAEMDQHDYQIEERHRQVDLGRDADKVLGDFPPWALQLT
jgi:hypothetical protein